MNSRHSNSIHLSLFVVLLPLFITLFSSSVIANQNQHQKPPELESVSLQLKWTHQFQFAGYYAAKLKGFYEAEGLDVTIKPRDLYENNIEQVINGKSEYGISDSMLMLYQAKGAPVKIVAPIFQHSPQVFISLKSSGVNSLFDFEGRTISFYKKDTDGFPLLAALHQNNIKFDLSRFEVKAGPETLENGSTKIYPAYLSNEPYYFYQKQIPINIIHPMHYGVDLYGDLIFTHANEVKNHPDRVKRFKRASIKGWQYALKNKTEIANYIINELNTNKTLDHLLYEAKVIEETISANSIPIGTLSEGRLEFIEKLFLEHQLLEKEFDLSKGIYQPENPELDFNRREIAWMKRNPEVKVAIDTSWHPIEFVNKNREYDGIAKGYFDYIHAKTGIKFAPSKHLSWSQAVKQMKSGELDMYAAVIKTPEREKYTTYTEPYLRLPMVIATRKGENYIGDLGKLENKKIAVVKDYAAQEFVETSYPSVETYLVDSVKQGLHAVAKGSAYGYIDNLAVVGFHIKDQGLSNSLQISGEAPFSSDVGMAIRKDWPELHSIINKVLASVDSQKQAELHNKWLKVEYKKQLEWQKVAYVMIPLILFMLIIMFYNRKLTKLNSQLHKTNEAFIDTQQKLESSNQRLEILSITDFLTGVYNRQQLDRVLKSELNRSQRYKQIFSILMIDLDNFKQTNDNFGHLMGDEVLKAVAKQVSLDIRSTDTFGRWGGEEFLIILPSTDKDGAMKIAKKIVRSIPEIEFDNCLKQTISIGVATYNQGQTIESMIEIADKNLYHAKHHGKNQACSLF